MNKYNNYISECFVKEALHDYIPNFLPFGTPNLDNKQDLIKHVYNNYDTWVVDMKKVKDLFGYNPLAINNAEDAHNIGKSPRQVLSDKSIISNYMGNLYFRNKIGSRYNGDVENIINSDNKDLVYVYRDNIGYDNNGSNPPTDYDIGVTYDQLVTSNSNYYIKSFYNSNSEIQDLRNNPDSESHLDYTLNYDGHQKDELNDVLFGGRYDSYNSYKKLADLDIKSDSYEKQIDSSENDYYKLGQDYKSLKQDYDQKSSEYDELNSEYISNHHKLGQDYQSLHNDYNKLGQENEQLENQLHSLRSDAANTQLQLNYANDVTEILRVATMLLTVVTGLFGLKSTYNFYKKVKMAAVNLNSCKSFKNPTQKIQCKMRMYKTVKAELMQIRSQCSKDKNAQICVAKLNKQIAKIDANINYLSRKMK